MLRKLATEPALYILLLLRHNTLTFKQLFSLRLLSIYSIFISFYFFCSSSSSSTNYYGSEGYSIILSSLKLEITLLDKSIRVALGKLSNMIEIKQFFIFCWAYDAKKLPKTTSLASLKYDSNCLNYYFCFSSIFCENVKKLQELSTRLSICFK